MISAAPVLLFCGIALAASLGVAVAALVLLAKAMDQSQEAKQQQLKLIERLTKLAAAKDIQTYHGLEAPAMQAGFASHEPMDDSSLASRLMGIYSENGVDPSLALDRESDPLEEFGGTSAFLGAHE